MLAASLEWLRGRSKGTLACPKILSLAERRSIGIVSDGTLNRSAQNFFQPTSDGHVPAHKPGKFQPTNDGHVTSDGHAPAHKRRACSNPQTKQFPTHKRRACPSPQTGHAPTHKRRACSSQLQVTLVSSVGCLSWTGGFSIGRDNPCDCIQKAT